MVEAAGPGPRPGREELLEQGRGQLAQPAGTMLLSEPDEQRQLVLLAVILAPDPSLVRQETLDGHFQGLAHRSTCSPSPRATSRRDSTATFNGTVGYQKCLNASSLPSYPQKVAVGSRSISCRRSSMCGDGGGCSWRWKRK